VFICILVGSAIPNSLSSNSIKLLAEEISFKHVQFLKSNFLQISVDIDLVRKIEIKPLAVIVPRNRWGGQCLAYVQKLKGCYESDSHFRGYPNKIKPNTEEAKIGNAVLTREGNVGHVALIKDVQGSELVLLESNYNGNEMITNNRILSINSDLIRGYYNFDDNKNIEETS